MLLARDDDIIDGDDVGKIAEQFGTYSLFLLVDVVSPAARTILRSFIRRFDDSAPHLYLPREDLTWPTFCIWIHYVVCMRCLSNYASKWWSPHYSGEK